MRSHGGVHCGVLSLVFTCCMLRDARSKSSQVSDMSGRTPCFLSTPVAGNRTASVKAGLSRGLRVDRPSLWLVHGGRVDVIYAQRDRSSHVFGCMDGGLYIALRCARFLRQRRRFVSTVRCQVSAARVRRFLAPGRRCRPAGRYLPSSRNLENLASFRFDFFSPPCRGIFSAFLAASALDCVWA
jgi:hypothetical protein